MNPNSLWLIPLSPFLGFLINGTVGRRLPRPLVTAIALFFTAVPMLKVLQLWIFMKAAGAPDAIQVLSGPWIQITGFTVGFNLAVDHLTLIMLGVVTGVGFLIHLYSAGYMAHEDGYWRFFAYLNLFMFFMSILVLAESFLLLFVGWEGVGLASYLLIGFYFTKDSAANAGKKAFIVNRIGDFGFLLAMFLLVAHFGSLSFSQVFAAIASHPEYQGGFLTAIALLLVVGATGKSAQIPLYIWLPDAMEGPTPVSALIHAATMVTAGIYMVARCHVLFDRAPIALGVRRHHRGRHGHLRRLHRHGTARHQARPRLLHRLPAWLYVPCLRSRCLLGRDLPPHDPRLLQGGSSSSPPAPSSTPSPASRTCARWADSANASPSRSGP